MDHITYLANSGYLLEVDNVISITTFHFRDNLERSLKEAVFIKSEKSEEPLKCLIEEL